MSLDEYETLRLLDYEGLLAYNYDNDTGFVLFRITKLVKSDR